MNEKAQDDPSRAGAQLPRREWLKRVSVAAAGTAGVLSQAGCNPAPAAGGPAGPTAGTAAGPHAAHSATPALVQAPATASAVNLPVGPPPGTRGTDLYELDCRLLEIQLAGTKVRLRSYNGMVPGPLLKTRPGHTLKVKLKNSLPPYDSSAWGGNHNVPHHLSSTNLHVHGLDVAPHLFVPVGTSDPLARMIHVPPGGGFDYSFALPDDHPPGLYWYHPHHHGSTAVQAVSGMAGGIVVYGDIDEVPEIKAARDIPLVVQDIGLFPSDDTPGLWEYNPRQNAIWQTFGGKVTVLGKDAPQLKGGFTTGDYALRFYLLNSEPFFKETHNPDPNNATAPVPVQLPVQRFQLAQGEVVRFRLLNACSDNLMPIVVEGHVLQLIAMDGVNFPAPRAVAAPFPGTITPQVLLAPANRAEFLIQAVQRPGIYRILQLAQAQQFLQSAAKVIAEIEVTAASKPMSLPKTLPSQKRYYPLIQDSEVVARRTIVFGGAFPGVANPVVGIDFLLNNMQYQEQAVPILTQLGAVEEWTLQVFGQHHGGTEGHPFHIHVNHFEVVAIGDTRLAPGQVTLQDTVWVPMKSQVVVRMRFKQFAGKAVFHCHILPHEDTGMMQNFLILPAGQLS